MKHIFLSSALLLASSVSFGATLVCEGPAVVSSVFFPGSMNRTATVLISSERSDLKSGFATASIGGEPSQYEGPLFLDGRKPHVIKHGTGEKTEFLLTLQGSQNVVFQMRMISADGQTILSVHPATLSCRTMND